MSHSETEFEKIEKMKKKLDSVSDSFCLVRWKHATLNLATGTSKSCCHLPFRELSLMPTGHQLHDNAEERSIREKMLKGEKVKDCTYCWWIEENGHTSDRQSWSAKSWMNPFFDEVKENLTPAASTPSWLELNFSSVCNLKCVYCSPIFSTKWYKEIKEYGPYKTSTAHNDISYLNSIEYEDGYENEELMKQFWPWFEKVLPGIRLLKLTGGEPLLSPHTLKMMRLMKEKQAKQVTLAVNSNLTIPPKKWQPFVDLIAEMEKAEAFDRFYLHPSLDCFGPRAEYIRHGLDLEALKANAETFLSQTQQHLFFICSLSNMALGSLLDFWKYILDLKQRHFLPGREISLTTEIVQYPQWLNMNILPEEYIEKIDEVISFVEANIDETGRGFQQVELEGLKKARGSFQSKPENQRVAMKDFAKFIDEVDRRRNTSFSSTFPELLPFYEQCKDLNKGLFAR